MHHDIRNFLQLLDQIPYDPKLSTYYNGTFDPEIKNQLHPFSNQFYYVLDYWQKELIYIHPNVENVLGFTPGQLNYVTLMEIIHPEDLPLVMKSACLAINFVLRNPVHDLFENDVMLDFRVRDSSGNYFKVLRQIRPIKCDRLGNLLQTIATITDISNLKQSSAMDFRVSEGLRPIGAFNEELSVKYRALFTHRELEMLDLLRKGLSSQEIADAFHLSKNTVDTHRRKMLRKARVKNTIELIALTRKT